MVDTGDGGVAGDAHGFGGGGGIALGLGGLDFGGGSLGFGHGGSGSGLGDFGNSGHGGSGFGRCGAAIRREGGVHHCAVSRAP